MRHITAICQISGNKLWKNEKLVFESEGSANIFLDKMYNHFEISYPKFHKMDMLCKLGFLATEVLLKDSNLSQKYRETETGLILSNAQASLDVDLKYEKTIAGGASPALFVYTLPNIVIGEISIRHRLKGENAFFVFRQFDGNFIAQYVNNLFDTGLVKACLCGWVDILKEDYRASLFLVEEERTQDPILFTGENLNKLNQHQNG